MANLTNKKIAFSTLRESVANLVHTLDGARVACELIGAATNKVIGLISLFIL